MGIYYSSSQVAKLGSVISGFQPTVNHSLVMVLDNGVYKIAADVTNKAEYDEFYRQYSQGYFLDYRVYLVSDENIKLCQDQGREPSTHIEEQKASIKSFEEGL